MKRKILIGVAALVAVGALGGFAARRCHRPRSPAEVRARVDARMGHALDALRAFAHETADAALKIHALLTPEQRAQVSRRLERFERFEGGDAR